MAWSKKKKKERNLFPGHYPVMTHRWCSLQEESQTSVHTARAPTTPPSWLLPRQPHQAPRSSKDRAPPPTPLPVYLPQAGSSAGHQGPRNIWAPSVKPHPCSPKLLRPWFPVFPVTATLILGSNISSPQGLALSWRIHFSVFLLITSVHMGYKPVTILYSLHLSYFFLVQIWDV